MALLGALFINNAMADNPIVNHMYTADPTARVMNGKLYIFPSTDVRCEEGFGNNGFCMPSYNVFSSTNLNDWTDHGLIVDQTDVPWGKKDGFGMWAPDAIEKEGKYYFYFPDIPTDKSAFRRVGVAIADKPEGPYTVMDNYIAGIDGIDPNVFIDKDGQAYIYWGGGEKLYGAKLKDNMVELASKPQVISNLPTKYKEGPFMFERNGIYYFTFPHAPDRNEELSYAIGDNPLGPFEYKGIFMEMWRDKQWTNHHSIVEYNKQWYVFYHHLEMSNDHHLRSIRADYLNFNADGSIAIVTPTERGIGIADATKKIQIDRYSRHSDNNVKVSMNSNYKLPGNWIVDYVKNNGWVNYDRVDFGQGDLTQIEIFASSESKGGVVEVRLGGSQGELIASVPVKNTGNWKKWQSFKAPLSKKLMGVQNLSFVFKADHKNYLFNIDWVRFNK